MPSDPLSKFCVAILAALLLAGCAHTKPYVRYFTEYYVTPDRSIGAEYIDFALMAGEKNEPPRVKPKWQTTSKVGQEVWIYSQVFLTEDQVQKIGLRDPWKPKR